ncbi:glycoside hydrolase family 2 [Parabacteroides sp. OttesenSCG-928-O15]|nr:glycoside hydrolase family 2 [Parabacteroides sp. OttesenSCG-928-O15]
MKHYYFLFIVIMLAFIGCQSEKECTIDLSGEWRVVLDNEDRGLEQNYHLSFDGDPIQLPGTTDDAGLGIPDTLSLALKRPQLTYLTRKNSYTGAAWYSREIEVPAAWKEKRFLLHLERAIWKTEVWVDGKKCEESNYSLVAPHVFDLTGLIIPGKKQTLTIRVDNRKQYEISNGMAHAYTDHTQIIWNGVIGEIRLDAVDPVQISQVDVYPNIYAKRIFVRIQAENGAKRQEGTLTVRARHKNSGSHLAPLTQAIVVNEGASTLEFDYDMGEDVRLWSGYSPELYELTVELSAGDSYAVRQTDFGMREIKIEGPRLYINGNPLFLRGTLECCIFPLTGYPPMTREGWEKVIHTAKEWGLNHLRFHSWCPPKAAFQAADEAGFYLQVELPVWINTVGHYPETTAFMRSEADRIIREYGNHPSFCLWSMGNEIEGDLSLLADMVDELKSRDPRHLYTNNTFTFQRGHGRWPEPNDDFFITQQTLKGWCRGQGVFNSEYPSFDKNYAASVEGMSVPLITHEVGQYAVYPAMDEISKYTGVLDPKNFKSIRADLEQKGILHKADDYTRASGRLAAILYKEEIERALKTAGIAGFQLLDLHDFPGQGTALVGLLDAFWESKGFIEAEEFRRSCAAVVPLLRFPKAVYRQNESFSATLDVSNYSEASLGRKSIRWAITDKQHQAVARGARAVDINQGYNENLLSIQADLQDIEKASQLTVTVSIDDTPYENSWSIWVYPAHPEVNTGDVYYTRDLKEAIAWLEAGRKVLFNPDWKQVEGLEGKFVPVFWSPVHFPRQAGSMGILCDPAHPAFNDFPTAYHTDWQWWDLTINSTTLLVDSLRGGSPIVEVIDNFVNNRRLAMIYEGKVGEGKLVMATCDLGDRPGGRTPEAEQLFVSLVNYMNSPTFDPDPIDNAELLYGMIKKSKGDGRKSSPMSVY